MHFFVVIHGDEGFSFYNPESDQYVAKNYYGFLANSLKEEGHACDVPSFPTKWPQEGIDTFHRFYPGKPVPEIYTSFAYQGFSNWLPILRNIVADHDPSTITLIPHSLGGAFAAKALPYLTTRGKPFHALVPVCPVGGPVEGLGGRGFSTFYRETDWEATRACAENIILFRTDNDPVVPVAQSDLYEKISGVSVTIKGGKHLNADSGYGPFPELKAVASLLAGHSGKVSPEDVREVLVACQRHVRANGHRFTVLKT